MKKYTYAAAVLLVATVAAAGTISVTGFPPVPKQIKAGVGISIANDTISATGVAVPISIQPFGNISTAVRGKYAPFALSSAFANYTGVNRVTDAQLAAELALKSPLFANYTTLARFGAGPTYNGAAIGTGGTAGVSTFNTRSGNVIAAANDYSIGQISGAATVAATGSYADLSGKPTLATVATSGAYSDLTGKPSLATVATSGSYTDLSNKPAGYTLPTASTTVLGGVKVDGTSVVIDGAGRISSTVSAGVATVDGASGVIDLTGTYKTQAAFNSYSTAQAATDAAQDAAFANYTGNDRLPATGVTAGTISDTDTMAFARSGGFLSSAWSSIKSALKSYFDGLYTDSAQDCTYVVAAVDAALKIRNAADYVCDGTADDVEINAALAALTPSANGGSVCLKGKGFNTTATLLMNNYQHLKADGSQTTTLNRSGDYGDTIRISANDPTVNTVWGARITGLGMTQTASGMTNGAGVHIQSAGKVTLEDVNVRNHWGAFLLEGVTDYKLDGVYSQSGQYYTTSDDTYHLRLAKGPHTTSNQNSIGRVSNFDFGPAASTTLYKTKYGVDILAADTLSLTDGYTESNYGAGLSIRANTDKSIVTVDVARFYSDCTPTDIPGSLGLSITGSTPDNFAGVSITDSNFLGMTRRNNAAIINSSILKGLRLQGNKFGTGMQDGLVLLAGTGQINGNEIGGNNTSAGAYSDLKATGGEWDISGNRFCTSYNQAGTAAVGLDVGALVTGSFGLNSYGSNCTTLYSVAATSENMRLHGPLEFADGTTMTTATVGGGGDGDVTAAAVIADNSIVRGDGGAKGVQSSAATISDTGDVTSTGFASFGQASDTTARLKLYGGSGGNDLVYLERTAGTTEKWGIAPAGGGLTFRDVVASKQAMTIDGGTTFSYLYLGYGPATGSSARVSGVFGEAATAGGLNAQGGSLLFRGGAGTGNAKHGSVMIGGYTPLASGTTSQSVGKYTVGVHTAGVEIDPNGVADTFTPETGVALHVKNGALKVAGDTTITGTINNPALIGTTSTTIDTATNGYATVSSSGATALTVTNVVAGRVFTIKVTSSGGGAISFVTLTPTWEGSAPASVTATKSTRIVCLGTGANAALCSVAKENF